MIVPGVLTFLGAWVLHMGWRRARSGSPRSGAMRVLGWLLLALGLSGALIVDGPSVGVVSWVMVWSCSALAAPLTLARWRRGPKAASDRPSMPSKA